MKQLESNFTRAINRNKYQSKVTRQTRNRNLDFLINPSFQGVNRLLVLSFEGRTIRQCYKKYFLLTVEITDYNIMIDGRSFFDQPVKNDLRAYDNIRKIGQGDDNATGYLPNVSLFQNLL